MASNAGAQQVVQQVNLYLPEIRPRKDLVTAARTLSTLAVLLVLMLLLSGYTFWQRASARSELADVQALVAAHGGEHAVEDNSHVHGGSSGAPPSGVPSVWARSAMA